MERGRGSQWWQASFQVGGGLEDRGIWRGGVGGGDVIRWVPRSGRRMLSEDVPSHYETSWHGSNLYVARTIIQSRSLEASYGSHGDYGVWSHKVSTRSSCGSYMYYIPSGSGVVWSVMFELRVDRNFTKKKVEHTEING